MCLSTVYRDKVSAENIVLSNVTRIECKDGMVILTDLLERQVAIHGQLLIANLIDGLAIIREEG